MIAAGVRLFAKADPTRNPVILQAAQAHSLLEKLKSRAYSPPELILRYGCPLRLRIVNIINIDAVESQIAERLLQLVLQVLRRYTVDAAGDVTPTRHSGLNELLFNIAARIAWRRVVK